MNRSYRQLIIMVCIFLSGWGIFSLITYLSRDTFSEFSVLSEANAEMATQAIHKMIITDYDTIYPEITSSAINQIIQRLEENFEDSCTFYIVDDEMVNAFATLNGNIYLTRGILEFADSPEVLAAVIAHEMGHHHHHDFEDRLSRNISISALEMIFTGGNSSLLSELSKTLFASNYDRRQEEAADAFAKEIMIKSGIHPENLGILFLGLEREYTLNLPEASEMFMSHPHLKSRIEEAIHYDLPENFKQQAFEIDWEEVQRELREL